MSQEMPTTGLPYSIYLIRGSSETMEEYLARCRDVANYALKRSPTVSEDPVIGVSANFSPEIIPHKEPMSQERDTHSQNFAKMLYEDFLQLQREDESSMKEFLAADYPEKWRAKVEQLIAQRAFDFADHLIKHLHGSDLDDIKHYGLARYLEEFPEGRERTPDMDKWPE